MTKARATTFGWIPFAVLACGPGAPPGLDALDAGWVDELGRRSAPAGGLVPTEDREIKSDDSYDAFGGSVASAGDVNGDGFADVVVGAYARSYYQGGAFVFLGSATGVRPGSEVVLSDPLSSGSTYFGWSVSGAGDVNGDGYDDVVVGEYNASFGYFYGSGAAWVFSGGPEGVDPSSGLQLTASDPTSYANFGYSVAGAGDVNGDGYGDIVVGSLAYQGGPYGTGAAYLYLGGEDGVDPSSAIEVLGPATDYVAFGRAVAGVGDTDGDGYGDVAVGAQGVSDSGSNSGAVFVFRGGPNGLVVDTATKIRASDGNTYDNFGASVARAGDVNGDGYDDLAVGAPNRGNSDKGAAYVYLGGATGIDRTLETRLDAPGGKAYDDFGQAVAGVGDLNGDGYADLAVGSANHDRGQVYDAGAVYLYSGGPSGVQPTTVVPITASDASASDQYGISVARAGDVDGDGLDEAIIGGPSLYSGSDLQGAVYLESGCGELGTWYADRDGDGYGDPDAPATGCLAPGGYVSDDTDCDDTLPKRHPHHREVVGDGIDEDCDGVEICWADSDGDGFTIPVRVASVDPDCTDPGEGLAGAQRDCDDGDPTIHPGVSDPRNDGVDANCDAVEEDVPARPAPAVEPSKGCGCSTGPGVGWGAVGPLVLGLALRRRRGLAAVAVAGLVGCGQTPPQDLDRDGFGSEKDCADQAPDVHPGAREVCNGVDDDCDGDVDEGVGLTAFADQDLDGYGAGEALAVCAFGPGLVATNDDCDDLDAAVVPGAVEVCDGVDQNCNGEVDEGLPVVPSWADVDGDGHGDPDTRQTSCDVPPGRIGASGGARPDDCDDLVAAVHPGVPEVCDGRDNDCNGIVDDRLLQPAWVDADGDGWGDGAAEVRICEGTPGFVAISGDCDDGDPDVNPDGVEVCNGVDDNCRDGVDDGVTLLFHRDADGDEYGDPDVTLNACGPVAGYVEDGTDCNDLDDRAFPGNPEVCDTVDNDCDGARDDGTPSRWFADTDQDGRGDPWVEADTCTAPTGFVADGSDCNDHDPVDATCPPSLYGDWGTMGGDASRSGYARGRVGDGTATLAWDVAASGLSYVSVARNRVFSSRSVDSEWYIVANDLYSGDELWESRSLGYGYLSGPAWVDGLVCADFEYFPPDSQVICVDEETGNEVWSTLTTMYFDTALPPIGVDGVLYSGGGGYGLFAHDLAFGNELFDDLLTYGYGWGPSAWSGSVYSWVGQRLTAHDPVTGSHLWSLAFTEYAYTDLAPVITSDGVAILADSARVHAVDLGTRTEIWSLANGALANPAVVDDLVYYVRADGIGRAVDVQTGALVRSFAGNSALTGTPVVTDDAVVFGSYADTYLYDRATGALLQHIAAGGSLAVADSHLLLADPNGHLRAYTW